MGKLAIVLGLLCVLLPLGMAHAQDDDDDNGEEQGEEQSFERPGWYLGVLATYAVENFHNPRVEVGGEKVSTNHDNSWGGNVRAGYRFNGVAAFEVEWEGLEGFDDTSGTGSEIEAWTLTGSIKGHVPLGRFQPYLLGGVGMMQARTHGGIDDGQTKESFLFRAGGGIDIYLTDQIVFATDVSYLYPTEDNKKLDYIAVSWGMLFRF